MYLMGCDISKAQNLLDKLGKHKTGKGCLYINRLTDSRRDPKLFQFDPLQEGPSGAKYTYSRICDGTAKRQPIVVDNTELENINNSYDVGSGPDSYSNIITTCILYI